MDGFPPKVFKVIFRPNKKNVFTSYVGKLKESKILIKII